jgi:cytochrome c biogenesis protein CcmG/thiol:disulfide interchange protein DsbE
MIPLQYRRAISITAWVIVAIVVVLVVRHALERPKHVAHAVEADVANLPLKQLDGAPLRLGDYKGKVLLIDFWASWCPPCREEIPQFVLWQKKYGSEGLQVIGVAMDDDPADAVKASRELGINYPVVVGSAEVGKHFGGILGLPTNIVMARNGEIVARRSGKADLPALELTLRTQLDRHP